MNRSAESLSSTSSVLVINSANPEVDRLAGELARRGQLQTFVRRYARMDRPWENALGKLPFVKGSTWGRRDLAPGLELGEVVDAGVLYDFMAAVTFRANLGDFGFRTTSRLLQMRNRTIARKGASLAGGARVVVGNYGVARRAFEMIKQAGGRTVLNYPNAYHRFQSKFFREEAEREPRFAPTLTKEVTTMAAIYERECALADTILVGSSFVRRSFEESGMRSDNIVVVPYGCDVSRFSPREGPGDNDNVFRALFVGQLTQRKGLSYLLKGFQAFRGKGTELVVVGKYIGDPAILDPFRDSFTYMDTMPHAMLAEVYRRCDVFVFPTLLEGMGLVVLEAMASGLPVITTDNGPGDLVRDGVDGFIVPIRDPEAIANRLEVLRSNRELRMAMGRSARARALEFTWRRYCEQAVDAVLEGSI